MSWAWKSPMPPAPPNATPSTNYPSRRASLRAPILNPYDKFTRPEFDSWIGDITSALKRALGREVEEEPKSDATTVADALLRAQGATVNDSALEVSPDAEGSDPVKPRGKLGIRVKAPDWVISPSLYKFSPIRKRRYRLRRKRWRYSEERDSEDDDDGSGEGGSPEPAIELSSDEESEEDVRISGTEDQRYALDKDVLNVDPQPEYDSQDAEVFPPHTKEAEVELSDPWEGPRTFAEDFYSGGDLVAQAHAELTPGHLTPSGMTPAATPAPSVTETKSRPTAHADYKATITDDMQDELPTEREVEISDPWDGPRTFAEDFYSGGDLIAQPHVGLTPNHLTPSGITPAATPSPSITEAKSSATAHADYKATITDDMQDELSTEREVEISDPWDGPRTFAEDFYSGGDRIAPVAAELTPSHLTPAGMSAAPSPPATEENPTLSVQVEDELTITPGVLSPSVSPEIVEVDFGDLPRSSPPQMLSDEEDADVARNLDWNWPPAFRGKIATRAGHLDSEADRIYEEVEGIDVTDEDEDDEVDSFGAIPLGTSDLDMPERWARGADDNEEHEDEDEEEDRMQEAVPLNITLPEEEDEKEEDRIREVESAPNGESVEPNLGPTDFDELNYEETSDVVNESMTQTQLDNDSFGELPASPFPMAETTDVEDLLRSRETSSKQMEALLAALDEQVSGGQDDTSTLEDVSGEGQDALTGAEYAGRPVALVEADLADADAETVGAQKEKAFEVPLEKALPEVIKPEADGHLDVSEDMAAIPHAIERDSSPILILETASEPLADSQPVFGEDREDISSFEQPNVSVKEPVPLYEQTETEYVVEEEDREQMGQYVDAEDDYADINSIATDEHDHTDFIAMAYVVEEVRTEGRLTEEPEIASVAPAAWEELISGDEMSKPVPPLPFDANETSMDVAVDESSAVAAGVDVPAKSTKDADTGGLPKPLSPSWSRSFIPAPISADPTVPDPASPSQSPAPLVDSGPPSPASTDRSSASVLSAIPKSVVKALAHEVPELSVEADPGISGLFTPIGDGNADGTPVSSDTNSREVSEVPQREPTATTDKVISILSLTPLAPVDHVSPGEVAPASIETVEDQIVASLATQQRIAPEDVSVSDVLPKASSSGEQAETARHT
ncbi:hypothetical protein EW146_g6941, partial [Bondarzewia mesenterica]